MTAPSRNGGLRSRRRNQEIQQSTDLQLVDPWVLERLIDQTEERAAGGSRRAGADPSRRHDPLDKIRRCRRPARLGGLLRCLTYVGRRQNPQLEDSDFLIGKFGRPKRPDHYVLLGIWQGRQRIVAVWNSAVNSDTVFETVEFQRLAGRSRTLAFDDRLTSRPP